MRILQLSNKPPYPPNDGSSIAIYNMCKGFMENGVEVHLFTINTKKHFKPDSGVSEELISKAHYKSIYKDTGVNPIGALNNLFFTNESYFISRFYFEEYRKELIRLLQTYSFDVVHFEGVFMADYLKDVRLHSKAKCVVRTHNIEYLIWDRMIANEKSVIKKKYLSIQSKRLKNFEATIIPQFDAVVPITAVDATYFQNHNWNKNIHVSPTGLLLDIYVPKDDTVEANSLFHFGAMDWMPNIEAVDWFIDEVFDQIKSTYSDAKFYVAGRDIPEHIKSKASSGVIIHGEVARALEFYNQNDIMVVPVLSGSGMRIKIIEGLAMGKAIVTTTIGVEGIPAKHNEHILIADTPAEFAKACIYLIQNRDEKQRIKKNARVFAETHFNNTTLVGEVVNFYSSL